MNDPKLRNEREDRACYIVATRDYIIDKWPAKRHSNNEICRIPTVGRNLPVWIGQNFIDLQMVFAREWLALLTILVYSHPLARSFSLGQRNFLSLETTCTEHQWLTFGDFRWVDGISKSGRGRSSAGVSSTYIACVD